MGLFSGIRNLALTVVEYGRHVFAPRVARVGRTMAGVNVTPDNAVQISAVWACLRYLSQTVAGLPWHVMRDGSNGAEIVAKGTPDYLIYRRPNKEWSSFQFRETLTHWALRWGNGYAEIERDQAGRPFALWPIHPERVCVCRDPETQEIYYEVTGQTGGKIEIDAADIFHLRGFGEGIVGVNVIDYAAQSLGWAKAAQLFGAAFFGNGANISTVVSHKKKLTGSGLVRVKSEFDQLYKGIKNSHGSVHVDTDATVTKLSLNAQETQLVEVHYFLIEEICRWFGVPPHKVAHLLRATFSNIEHQAIEVVVDSVMPWVKRFEDEADYKLFGEANRQNLYTKMNMRGLLRGDNASRVAFYKEMFAMGAYSPNRILELEDENTLGVDGDKHLVQLNLTTLEKSGVVGTDKYAEIKAKFDAYGVGVRAGAITPQEDDEDAFREQSELPPASSDVEGVWKDEPTRRPITLAHADGSSPLSGQQPPNSDGGDNLGEDQSAFGARIAFEVKMGISELHVPV